MKFEVGDDFSKILLGDDISREIVPKGRFSPQKSSPGNFGMISPGDDFFSTQRYQSF